MHWREIADIQRNGYNFTDGKTLMKGCKLLRGCGFISMGYAKKISEFKNISFRQDRLIPRWEWEKTCSVTNYLLVSFKFGGKGAKVLWWWTHLYQTRTCWPFDHRCESFSVAQKYSPIWACVTTHIRTSKNFPECTWQLFSRYGRLNVQFIMLLSGWKDWYFCTDWTRSRS
jgi:hypothetical protein